MKREISIIAWNEKNNINEMLSSFQDCSKTIFCKNGVEHVEGVQCVDMPIEIDNQCKAKNFVNDYWQQKMSEGHDVEWLHVLEDNLEIARDPHEFMSDIEHLLDVLELNSWLDTTTDVCNRVYQKYNPRVRIGVDNPELKELDLNELVLCSHSNTQWMVFNIKKGDKEELHFDTRFTIPMYWIIEYLARRRSSHPEGLYFMNQYFTCPSEENLFKNKVFNDSDKKVDEQAEQEKMKEEDAIFKSMNVNYAPDNNIDMLLEKIYNKLTMKIEKKG